jgi:UDP-GlcNAc3NAcA epimerase
VDDPVRLGAIFASLGESPVEIVLPCHPRLRQQLERQRRSLPAAIRLIDPVGYLDMIALEKAAKTIVTDSGGVQKEAYFWRVPCITLRPETEWVETVEAGWNMLADVDGREIVRGLTTTWWPETHPLLFGDGCASERIAVILASS